MMITKISKGLIQRIARNINPGKLSTQFQNSIDGERESSSLILDPQTERSRTRNSYAITTELDPKSFHLSYIF